MANKDREITIKVTLDGNNAVKGSAKVKQSVRGIKDETGQASKGMKGFGLQTVATGAIAAAALTKIVEYGKEAVTEAYRLATDSQETASKFKTVLGPSIQEANEFLDENAAKMGLNETAAKDLLATNAAIAQGFGFTGSAAADMAMKVVSLAGDLTSFNNVPIERTQNAVTTALSGETEALKSLGIVLRQAEVQERAMANTGKESADALTQQDRATASLQLITEKAGVAVGDLNRTQNSTANQARETKAEFEDLQIELSERLLPVFQEVVSSGEGIVSTLLDWVKVPLSENLRAEQTSLNTLVYQITAANTSQKDRNDLIGTLQNTYPEFLKNLDAEKVTNEQLAGRLEDVNQQYIKRIALQSQKEKLQDLAKTQGRYVRVLAEEKQRLRDIALQINTKYKTANIDYVGKSFNELAESIKNVAKSNASVPASYAGQVKSSLGLIQAAQKGIDVYNNKLDREREILKGIEDQYSGVTVESDKVSISLQKQKTAIEEQLKKYGDGSQEFKIYKSALEQVNTAIKKQKEAANKASGMDGMKGLTGEIKTQKEALDALNNKKGEWTTADREQAKAIAWKIHQLEQLLAKRKELEKIPPTPVVEPKKPDEQPIKANPQIDTSGKFDAGDPIIDTLTKRMLKEQEYFQLQQRLTEQRQLLDQAETASARQKAQANIDALRNQMATLNLLRDTVISASQAQITSLEEYGKYIAKTVKKAIKARLAQAVATQIEKALATIPFPFNVAAAAAAGGAVSLLFNKIVPDFNRGGVLRGPSHAQGGIPVMKRGSQVAEAEGGEAFINTRSTGLFYNELSAINQAGGGARFPGAKTMVKMPATFAGGGPVGNSRPDFGRRYATTQLDSEMIAHAIRQGLEGADIVTRLRDSVADLDEKLTDYRAEQQLVGN